MTFNNRKRQRQDDGLTAKHSCCQTMRTKVQIPSTQIKRWSWPHASVTLALREVEKGKSLEIAEFQPGSSFSERPFTGTMQRLKEDT